MTNGYARVVLIAMAALPALAAPQRRGPGTTYKPADIARAKQNLARHAWAKRVYQRIRARTERYAGMDRELRSDPLLRREHPGSIRGQVVIIHFRLDRRDCR